MWNNSKVSLVFPAYNEELNIFEAVSEFISLKDICGKHLIDEVIVVDNNSQDKSAELARKAGARVVQESLQGYGYALRRGLLEATGEFIILCEPDGTFVSKDIFKLLVYSDDFPMVCGTRTTREMIWQQANMAWPVRVGNLLVAKLMQLLYGTCSISDCGCTFRMIRREAAKRMLPLLHVGGSHFLPNMVIAASREDIPFLEVPVNYRGRVGVSKITGNLKGLVLTAINMIWLIIYSWPDFLKKKIS